MITAEIAMAEIWATTCADCGPEDYEFMVEHVRAMQRYLSFVAPVAPGETPAWLKGTPAE